MSDTSRLLIALSTHNECDAISEIPEIIEEILRVVPAAQILVVDDNSSDDLANWILERRKNDARILLLRRAARLGFGSAMLAAFQYAIDYHYDWLLVLDADGSHCPQFIPTLLAASANADVVIGSRYVAGGKVEGGTWRRRIGSRLANFLARQMLLLTTRDSSCSFRLYRVNFLSRVPQSRIVSHGYSFFAEILFRLKQCGARIKEVPITFRDCRNSQPTYREIFSSFGVLFYLSWERW